MSEHAFDDPHLAFLESQLAAMNLRVSPELQQQMLYQCGMAAGQRKSKAALWRWKIAASTLAVLVAVAVSAPYLSPEPSPITPKALQVARRPIAVKLDAWQLSPPEVTVNSDEIARLAQNDPKLRSLTVGTLTRQALEQ